jgi:hypothetical protein
MNLPLMALFTVPEEVLDVIYIGFMVLPIVGYYITLVHYRWLQLWKPSPFLRHLLYASIANDVSATLIGFVAASVYFEWDMPLGVRTLLLVTGVGIALSVKVWRRFDLRSLDNGPLDDEQHRDLSRREAMIGESEQHDIEAREITRRDRRNIEFRDG